MATRRWFSRTAAAGFTLPTPDAGWDKTAGAGNLILENGLNDEVAIVTGTIAASGTADHDTLLGHFYSEPLDVNQTISGTVKGQMRFSEASTLLDARSQVGIRVIQPDGTVRGTLLALDTGALFSEWSTALTNRNLFRGGSVSLSSVNAIAGDRIEVAVGGRQHAAGTNNTSLSYGAPIGGTDLAENETDTGANAPWIEFSQDITFDDPAARVTKSSIAALLLPPDDPDARVTKSAVAALLLPPDDPGANVTKSVLSVLVSLDIGAISDSVTISDSIHSYVGRTRLIEDDAITLLTHDDDFSAPLGPFYLEVEGLETAGGVLVATDAEAGTGVLDQRIAPPADISFDFLTPASGDSYFEIGIGGGKVTLEAIDGGDISVYVDPDRTEVASLTFEASTLYHVEARVAILAGETVTAKLWKDGTSEPGSPQAEFALPAGVDPLSPVSSLLLEGGGAVDNLHVSGYVGDFILTSLDLVREVVDSVTISEFVGEPEPVDYVSPIEDEITVTDHVTVIIDRNVTVDPIPSPRAPVVSVTIDGVDVWQDVDFNKTRLTTYANGNPGAGELWIRDLTRVYAVPTGAEVIVRYRGVPVWGGFALATRREYVFNSGSGVLEPRYLVLEAVDYNILFRKRVYYDKTDPTNMLVFQWPNGTHDDHVIARVTAEFLDLAADGLSFDLHHVGTPALPTDSCNPDAPDVFGVGSGGHTWGDVMAAISNQTGAVYYIDPEKVVRYVDDSTRQSRFGFDGLSDQPDGVTMAGYSDCEISYDGAGLVNEQYTWGMGQGSEDPVLGREIDDDSVSAHGLWQAAEIRFDMYCQESVDRRAETWVHGSPQNRRGGKDDKVTIRLTVFHPYFRVGDVIAFENQSFDISDDIPVRGAEITFPTPYDIKMVLTVGHTIDAPWNTHEFLFPDIGLPEVPPPDPPDPPKLPPFCLCCDWVPEGTQVTGPLLISTCHSSRIYDYDYFWNFEGVGTFDTTTTYDWDGLVISMDSDALDNPVGRVPGTATASAPGTGRFPLSSGSFESGQFVHVELKGSRNSLSSWGGAPPKLTRKRYFIRWFGASISRTELLGETFTNRFTFGLVANSYNVALVEARLGFAITGFIILAENQQYIDDVSVSAWHTDGECDGGGAGGVYLTPDQPASSIVEIYAGDGTLLVEGVDWEISPMDPSVILPITTWWLTELAEGPTVVYIPLHIPHPCDDMEVPDFTIDPPGDGDTIGDNPAEGDTDVDGVFFHLSAQFLPGSTQVWVDGLRIRLNADYIEYPSLAKIKILDHIDVGSVSVTASYINFVLNSPVPE